MHQTNARSQETYSLIWNPHLTSKYCLAENLTRVSKNTSLSLQQVFTLIGHASCVNTKEFGADNHGKRRMGKWIHIFSVFIVIIPTRLLCQM